MSSIVRETLMAIPPDDFLQMHSDIAKSQCLKPQQATDLYHESRLLFDFGRSLKARTTHKGWDPPFPHAIRSGSNRLFLSTLKWLKPQIPTPAEIVTRNWLRTTPLRPMVEPEVIGLTQLSFDTDKVTDAAEEELTDYPAFIALGQDIEPFLFEKGSDIKVAAIVRLGIVLGGLAIKRKLTDSQIVSETTIAAVEVSDLEKWFSL